MMILKKYILWFFVLLVGVVMMVAALLATIALNAEFRVWLTNTVIHYAAQETGYTLSIKALDFSDIKHLNIKGIEVEGPHVISIEEMSLVWNLDQFFEGQVDIGELRITNVVVDTHRVKDLSSAFTVSGLWYAPSINGHVQANAVIDTVPLSFYFKGSSAGEDVVVEHVKLVHQDGESVELKGHYRDGNMDFVIKTDAFSTKVLSDLGVGIKPGKIKANIAIKGHESDPVVSGYLALTSKVLSKKQNYVIKTRIELSTVKSITRANIQFYHDATKLGYVEVSLPLKTYLHYDGPQDYFPVKGTLTSQVDLAHIQAFLSLDSHNIKGNFISNLIVSGTRNKPIVEGSVELKSGYYENTDIGVGLYDVTMNANAQPNGVATLTARATDGQKGVLLLSGNADFFAKTQDAVSVKLTVDNAKLLRRTDIDGQLSGDLLLAGSLRELFLKGALTVMPLAININSLLTEGIPSVQVTEVRQGDNVYVKASSSAPDSAMPVIKMDIIIKADRRAFLRGRGLEAELEGNINITGTLAQSFYSGVFKTIRGSYEILGKKFTINQGTVRFEGEAFSLAISGVHKTKEIQVTAQISGALEDLELTLSSNPSMPQDEIISHLLFGKSSAKITPLQAIKLANAVRSLKNGGQSMFDPLGTARDVLGVDSISVESEQVGDEQEVTVGVGKYISERVYLEVEKGSDPSKPLKGKVEIEVTPHLNVESSTGNNAGLGGVDLQFKYDY